VGKKTDVQRRNGGGSCFSAPGGPYLYLNEIFWSEGLTNMDSHPELYAN